MMVEGKGMNYCPALTKKLANEEPNLFQDL
jgi:hypothetical protein